MPPKKKFKQGTLFTWSATSCSMDSSSLSPSAETSTSSGESVQASSLYKGNPLNMKKLKEKYAFLEVYQYADRGPNERKRRFVKCLTCANNETVALRNSKNGQCPIASGIRVDSDEKIQQVIDHLESMAHKAATENEELVKKYDSLSEKHPWLSVLKKHREETINFLIQLAMDVQ